jgi:predicted metal-dependent phosphoesterase TrpH
MKRISPGDPVRVEFHSHTVYSPDGHIGFTGLVRSVRRNRLDIVAITDHDTIEGAIEFRRLCERRGLEFAIIVGEERTLADGTHVIGLFLKEALASLTFDDVLREIQGQNGVCVVPHPLRRRDGALSLDASRLASLQRASGLACGFEIFNPRCSHDENLSARRLLNAGLCAVGGSDAHYESDHGEAVNVLPFAGDVETTVRRALAGAPAPRVLGVRQSPAGRGRVYAEAYYRHKRLFRIPEAFKPAAKTLYRFYRNRLRIVADHADLEEKSGS